MAWKQVKHAIKIKQSPLDLKKKQVVALSLLMVMPLLFLGSLKFSSYVTVMLVDAYANMFWAAAFQTCVIIHLLSASDNFMLQIWGFVFPFSPPFF